MEFIDNQVKSIFHGNRHAFIAPAALTVFVWVLFMNAMDFLPVDIMGKFYHNVLGLDHWRSVPTSDVNATFALALSVWILMIFFSIKVKGLGGWVHELFTAPFGNHWALWPFNFLMQIIEFVAKTVSHGMRLFGNMYAGELIFLLIALMGGAFSLSGTGIGLAIGHIIAGTAWAIFHILIITLQAFVFMMLALVYVGQAHDAH
jgi:F-type H+-transporting ATPase subunit a